MSLMSYKPNAVAVLERLRALYERRAPDRICAVFSLPSKALAEFKQRHSGGPRGYPDPAERIRFWDNRLKENAALQDDSIPSAYFTEFDQGLYAGLLGAEVRFLCNADTGWISSMGLPLLKDWSEFGRLRLDDACAWSAMYERQMRVFVQGARDRFGISHFILINGLNFIFELIGAMETYTSLMETPDMVREAMELGFRLNLSVQKRFFDAVPLLAGGTCGLQVQWVPGRILAESVDPFHMTSVACFEEWGRAISERMFAMFDGGVTHIHGNGRHLLEPVHTLSGLKAIILGDDIGFPPAIEILSDLRKRIGDIPLVVNVRFGVFAERLKRRDLPGGVLYIVESAPGVDEANKLMDTVRAYRT